jgi:hypothetical protein
MLSPDEWRRPRGSAAKSGRPLGTRRELSESVETMLGLIYVSRSPGTSRAFRHSRA